LASAIAATVRKHPQSVFLSGMAVGIDQMAADLCVESEAPWVAAIPFPGQDARWPTSARQHYETLLHDAWARVLVSDGPYAAAKLHARNRYMVERSDGVIAYFDEAEVALRREQGRSPGGTAACIADARRFGVPVWNV